MGVIYGEVFEWDGKVFYKNVRFKVGVGDRVKF